MRIFFGLNLSTFATAVFLSGPAMAQIGAASVPPPPPPPPPPAMAAPMPAIMTSPVNNEALSKRIHSPLFITSSKAKNPNVDGGQQVTNPVTTVENYNY